ncbi:XRE family transcriptional regulator [Rhizobium sp. NFR03]|uniref:helix-turn-helix domain-containing protein n=1 Tax=Rhizobium sp. NFR03 TaxID=1566263 RepID=UPI0008D6AC43|nr:XRE family transcriptional regulator [Rhizobium sp. NFR03]SER94308.1 Predicted DNA-binding protein, contains XRE-type HTH domain [Rhizobium sp. NFR03]
MMNETFANVWDAIEDNPAEAENLKLRSKLMAALEHHIRAEGWTTVEAADRLSVTQQCVSDLMRGKISLFSIDVLVTLLVRVGLHVDVLVRDAA